MALGSLGGATAYYQWEAAVLSRRLELSRSINDMPSQESNLLYMAQNRANNETGFKLIHYSDNDR